MAEYKEFEKFMNEKVKVIGILYKNKGRPKNNDYVVVSRKDVEEIRRLRNLFKFAFSTNAE